MRNPPSPNGDNGGRDTRGRSAKGHRAVLARLPLTNAERRRLLPGAVLADEPTADEITLLTLFRKLSSAKRRGLLDGLSEYCESVGEAPPHGA